jgi:hypothetical protein
VTCSCRKRAAELCICESPRFHARGPHTGKPTLPWIQKAISTPKKRYKATDLPMRFAPHFYRIYTVVHVVFPSFPPKIELVLLYFLNRCGWELNPVVFCYFVALPTSMITVSTRTATNSTTKPTALLHTVSSVALFTASRFAQFCAACGDA